MEVGKILIAQKSGLISLYNSSNYAPIMSLDCCSSPLMSADWCLSNSLCLAAAVASDIVFFDLSRPSLPTERRSLHGDGARLVRFSRWQDTLTASVGKPAACLKVNQHRAGQTLLTSQKKIIGGGLSWHLRLPYLAVGNDREVDLYRLHL
jgi:nuclear pore complex protein Nup37